jgi:hypothetical protein
VVGLYDLVQSVLNEAVKQHDGSCQRLVQTAGLIVNAHLLVGVLVKKVVGVTNNSDSDSVRDIGCTLAMLHASRSTMGSIRM